jgi:probable phosphoglycerate mutase
MDVELSSLGEEQALATAGWALTAQLVDPLVFASPYRRAARTAQLALRASPVRLDERLREREFGILDRLTRRGIEAIYPEQAATRAFLGKFYHRPPATGHREARAGSTSRCAYECSSRSSRSSFAKRARVETS